MEKRSVRFAIMILAALAVQAPAAQAQHNHGATAQPGAEPTGFDACLAKESGDAPSMRCSPVVTASADGQGRLWLAWVHGGHVYVSSTRDGEAAPGAPVRVTVQPQELDVNGENRPKTVVAPNGDIYLTFTAKGKKKFTGIVYFSRSLDGGKSFSAPVPVSDEAEPASQRFDAISVDPEGRIHIAWLDKRDLFAAKTAKTDYIGAAIYYARSDDRGASFTANRSLYQHTCECCRVAMAIDRKGLPVIVWRNIYGKDVRDHSVVSFLDVETPAPVTRLSDDEWHIDACPHHGPAVAVTPDNTYHVVWYTDGDRRSGLFHARSTDGGKTFSTPVTFGNPDRMPAHADIAAVGGRLYVTWKEFNGDRSELLVMSSPDGGGNWSAPMVIAATADESDHPLFVDDGRWLHVSWQTSADGWLLRRVAGH